MHPGWLKIEDAASYAGVSKRTFEAWLKNGLRYVQPGRKRLTRPEWVDEYLGAFEASQQGNAERIDQVVDDVCKGFSV